MSPTAQVVTADKTLKSVIANANSAADTFAESVKDSPLAKFNPKADDPLVNSLVTVKNLVVGYAEDFKKSGTLDKLKSYGSSLETSFKGIENKLRETKSEDVAKALGINVEKLDRINEIKLSQLKETSEKLTLNLAASLKNGLRLENVPADKFLNIPTAAPDTKAPEPVVLNMDLINQNLERAFGVNSKDKIPGFVPPQLINDLKGSAKQFAQAIESSRPQIEADVVAFKGKMESVTEQIKNATGKFQQSAESFKSNLNELSNKVAINLYGNKSSESPLDKIINS
jgi:DNA anti-recombination protein RmuC